MSMGVSGPLKDGAKVSGPPEIKTFVLQKYIESPFLINKRKFDIRVWVLLNQDMDLFFFK